MKYILIKNCKDSAKGQMLIIVILTMVISLTVGLTLVSRTVTNLKVSKENEQSSRAFQAAEAGIEQALKDQTAPPSTASLDLSNNASFTYSIQSTSGTNIILNAGDPVLQTKGIDLWLSNYPNYSNKYGSVAPATITVYWGISSMNSNCTSGINTDPALEIVVLQGNITSPTLSKLFYDPCASRRVANKAAFPTVGSTTITDSNLNKTITFLHGVQISVTNGIIAKIIPVYNSTPIGIIGSATVPSQGKIIFSTGNSGDAARKLKYFVSYPQIPTEIFPQSITSQDYKGE